MRRARVRRLLAGLAAAFLLGIPAVAESTPSELSSAPSQSAESADSSEGAADRGLTTKRKAFLVIGGAVLGVTGFWVRMYQAGKQNRK